MKRSDSIVSRLAVLAGICVLYAPVPAAATTYGGRATGLVLNAPSQPSMSACDTGELPPGGGNLSDFVPNALLSGNTVVAAAASLTCTASGSADVSQCESQAADVSLDIGLATRITLKSVSCVAVSGCVGVSGETSISGLAIGGVSVVVTGEANQTVQIPGVGTLVINEQVHGSGTIAVNALHLTLLDSTEIVVCGTRASIDACSPLPVEQSTWGKVKALYR
jgi:hypothetical protein